MLVLAADVIDQIGFKEHPAAADLGTGDEPGLDSFLQRVFVQAHQRRSLNEADGAVRRASGHPSCWTVTT